MEDESSQAIKAEEVHSTPIEADISHQGHQSQQYATNEETRVAAETLKLLRGTDDPNESPPKEEAYFGGSGLMDHIRSSQKRKKGLQFHQTVQHDSQRTNKLHDICTHQDSSVGQGDG